MRKLFLGAAALVALAAPGVAAANGYVGLDYNTVDSDAGGDADAVGVSGSVVLSPNVALDAGYADGDDASAYGVTGHLFTNNSQYLVGGFLGVSGGDSDVGDDSTAWGGGVEGQYYMNNVTLAAALGYSTNDDSDVDVWGLNGEARYFISENFRIEGGLGWFSAEADGGFEDNALSLGVGGEYQFAAAPVSIGLGYTNVQFDELDFDVDTISATVRYNFGGGSLLDRDRSGGGLAGLSGVNSLGL
jgi:hypothetical protein